MELLEKIWEGGEVKFSKKDLHSPQIREWYGEKKPSPGGGGRGVERGGGVLHCHAFLTRELCVHSSRWSCTAS